MKQWDCQCHSWFQFGTCNSELCCFVPWATEVCSQTYVMNVYLLCAVHFKQITFCLYVTVFNQLANMQKDLSSRISSSWTHKLVGESRVALVEPTSCAAKESEVWSNWERNLTSCVPYHLHWYKSCSFPPKQRQSNSLCVPHGVIWWRYNGKFLWLQLFDQHLFFNVASLSLSGKHNKCYDPLYLVASVFWYFSSVCSVKLKWTQLTRF